MTSTDPTRPPIPSRRIAADDPVPGAQNIILVMSGKGGVGKSTVASNLTMALKRLGYRVGLLDADMYGPSLPTMFGVSGRPRTENGKIQPLERFGVKLMSLGFLLDDPKAAVVWRGPMLHGALMQFLGDVSWGDLDFLILDLPPGTGDVALTLAQKLSVNGSVVVTTPQEVALQDVYKSVSMNRKVGIPITGVVENASVFICDGCGKAHRLYGEGGGEELARFAGAPLLGQIPIDPEIRKWGDQGVPVVEAAPASPAGQAFQALALRFLETLETGAGGSDGELTIDRSGGTNRHLPLTKS
jgi:ATP-binding protein involved in chromosome partitioning